MSNERDELTELIYDKRLTNIGDVTDAILAAGYRKPREVVEVEELNALPDGTLIEYHSRIGRTQRHSISALNGGSVLVDKSQALPVTVLWEPTL